MPPSISAIIISYNEEKHIEGCLQSLVWCSDLWVVDSFSTDHTVEISRRYTPHVLQHPFKDFADQRNWCLDNLALAGDWVLFVDCDQRVTPELREEILRTVDSNDGSYAGYYIPRLQYFWGKPMRYGWTYPMYDINLFRKGKARYAPYRIVHELLELDGKAGFLKNPFIQIAKDTLAEYIDRVNKYSDMDARRMHAARQELYTAATGSYSRWNQAQKSIFKFLPFKPFLMFLYIYFLQQGFREGYRGYLYAMMQGFYVFACYAKRWELEQGLTPMELGAQKPTAPARDT